MDLRTKSFGVRSFILTFSISCLYVFLTAYPGKAFAESKGGSLPDFDFTSPELLAAKQEATDASTYNQPGEQGKYLNGPMVTVKKSLFPIIFLPGVAGTKLHLSSLGGLVKKELWPAPTDIVNDWDNIYLDENGNPLTENVFPGDILRYTDEWLWFGTGVYKDLLESIQSIKFGDGVTYKEGENLFPWGYDWRLDNNIHLSALDKFVDEVIQKTKSKKVILIAHSMGGLISRAYAVKHRDKVETIISIGSPFAGSPKPFYGLVMGYNFGNKLVYKKEMKKLFQNTPSAYQLLPQYDFVIDSTSGPNPKEIPNEDFYNKIKYKNLPKVWFPSNSWHMNQKLLEQAKRFYMIIGTSFNPVPLPSTVKHYAIIGVGVRTLDGFLLKQASSSDQDYLAYNGQNVVLDPSFGNGDGTVPLKSANIKDTTGKYFIHHIREPHLSGGHGDLPNNTEVQGIVKSILLEKTPEKGNDSPATFNLVNLESDTDFTLR